MADEKFQTLSIVAGTMACNARCPDCISKMTTDPEEYRAFNFEGVDWRNFRIAVSKAIAGGARAVLITGKGEPTLYPEQLNDYLEFLRDPRYGQLAIKELQTNALHFHNPKFYEENWLQRWYDNDLSVMCLSVVDIEDEANHEFYNPHQERYPPLEKTVDILHDAGYTIRLSITMIRNRVDCPEDIERVVDYCKKQGIEQLSVRPVRRPQKSFNQDISEWVEQNELTPEQEQTIVEYVHEKSDVILERLMHGAYVFQFRGQNLGLTDCITHKPEEEGHRQLIFYSNGMLMYDWTHPGAIILGAGKEYRDYLKTKTPGNKG